jgi:tetratricopeptide (TPR) repeat protein
MFVLAVAAKFLFRKTYYHAEEKVFHPRTPYLEPAWSLALFVCLGLATQAVIRVTSVGITARANDVQRLDDAIPLYQAAMRLDDENPDVRQNLGVRLLHRGRYAEAIPLLESAIRIGRGTSTDFSYLATAKSLSGDHSGAEATMAQAAVLYPRSPFVLARYSALLEINGKTAESTAAFQQASAVDHRAATTWRGVITTGPKAVSEMAATDDNYLQVMELVPTSAMYAVVIERYIKHPDEQRFSMLKVRVTED